jgi:hypothetical protein
VASVSIPNYEPWIVSRWAFRTLAERAQSFVSDPNDIYKLQQAVALDGLHFDLVPADQCVRLERAVDQAADGLRDEFRDRSDQRDLEFADLLDVLRLRRSDLTGS